jgi:hypothetical protein
MRGIPLAMNGLTRRTPRSRRILRCCSASHHPSSAVPMATPTTSGVYQSTSRLTSRKAKSPCAEAIDYDPRTDDMFPLLSHADPLSAKDLLEKDKFQPQLETRHEQLKTVRVVAPALLKSETPIEALLMVYFAALLLDALIERAMRRSMVATNVRSLRRIQRGASAKPPRPIAPSNSSPTLQRHELFNSSRPAVSFGASNRNLPTSKSRSCASLQSHPLPMLRGDIPRAHARELHPRSVESRPQRPATLHR